MNLHICICICLHIYIYILYVYTYTYVDVHVYVYKDYELFPPSLLRTNEKRIPLILAAPDEVHLPGLQLVDCTSRLSCNMLREGGGCIRFYGVI